MLPGGVKEHRFRYRIPQGDITHPSAARLLLWHAEYQRARYQSSRFQQRDRFLPWLEAPDPNSALRLAVAEPESLSKDPLEQLAWAGLLQPIGGVRTFMAPQCCLICALPTAQADAAGAEGAHQLRFLRLTLPLEDGGE
jgi:hypothetical protein